MSELILYTTEDGRSQIRLRADQQTVWLTQLEMAELFDATKQNISLHLKNIFEDGELDPAATVKDSLTVQTEGSREVRRTVTLYNLDAILAVGYRVRSPRGVQFRRWASTVLKEYLLKGFVLDDERLKNPDGRPDHFDEMLARIRDIRASEKRFYQKVRDLFALSSDYDKSDQATQTFFATVQNLLLYAVTQQTAAELITARANPDDRHFGLLNWQGARVRKQDILLAKNYLTEDEIDTLNRLVVIFLETAELRTKRREEIRMSFWRQNVDQIIASNGFPVLTHAGKLSHAQMERTTSALYDDYDQRRKQDEARQADEQDEAELQALENTLKKRPKP
ncbi:virulence RhuM family protein [Methyloversatilis sp. XJ19-13]|uniref:virulence RhuM family protein n=1 Tax=Methyloversatilis sp. XJ19-13 TaxID=2963430 RepID=UPI00211CA1F1|nr:virulence RhuM family protein [Methyloversatilis sp. XJ19-13]MCQ9375388.1 virulence RhuM family protein [Methyloversatilis sp. XJ19-13]